LERERDAKLKKQEASEKEREKITRLKDQLSFDDDE